MVWGVFKDAWDGVFQNAQFSLCEMRCVAIYNREITSAGTFFREQTNPITLPSVMEPPEETGRCARPHSDLHDGSLAAMNWTASAKERHQLLSQLGSGKTLALKSTAAGHSAPSTD